MREAMERLNVLLDAEREALIGADFDHLSAIGAEKSALLQEIDVDIADQDAMADLAVRLEHLHALTDAVLAGMRDARARVDAWRQAALLLNSYGPNGDARCIETQRGDFSRRA